MNLTKESYTLSTNVKQLLSSEQAYEYQVVPIAVEEGKLVLKSNDTSSSFGKELEIILGTKVDLQFESKDHIKNYLATNYRIKNSNQVSTLNYSNDFLDKLLSTAKSIGSSDIHFEIYENRCRIRLRLDGRLKEYFIISKNEYLVIINKLKIKSGLDISEKRLPQDGRITIKNQQGEFDIRVSSLPTLYGEKLVLRILNKDANQLDLEDLGFSSYELKTYKEAIKKPNGIILISGPTGSGKTTTLYATLKLLNGESSNILTIEDPIEYTLDGINQVQLKESIGLDFTSTLKTFLRQDPDVIMVGEIRDPETANMAIRASLTGHLVLSTIHTNSAWATISRLIDMGVPAFLIASTLNISIAQRLVRLLCIHCKQKVDTEDLEIEPSLKKLIPVSYRAVGCPKCHFSGYQGRKAVYEIIPISKDLIELIRANKLQIDGILQEKNIDTLKSNALRLIKEGLTSVDEVYSLIVE
jgi:type IV pilus assembly protein PilB